MDECQKKYNLGLVIGRFQGLHVGHEFLIQSAYEECENLLVLVGSAQEKGTMRNPFDLRVRIGMLKALYKDVPNLYIGFINDLTNENDHSTDWIEYLFQQANEWKDFYGVRGNFDAMCTGNDEERKFWLLPQDIKQLNLDRANIPVSSTIMRGYLAWNSHDLWTQYTNPRLHIFYQHLRKQLMEVK
ncbi:hypothetical protein BSK59_15955 [Paenibacillus odorifer]|uniref:adenylyltransferase/cytidyltransferase family protein n=1 Tax=Paenibacillus odorifer TaxID=189426 RepID=UPI00096DCC1A|nr:adenylyltransferase/cytidyltransferase family protein [Paenibacillus odorifer]OME54074.1 hypothetical protein BSK59_15955 [Paenibacillus odorifer]